MPGLISRTARVAIITKYESTIIFSKLENKEEKQALLALKLQAAQSFTT